MADFQINDGMLWREAKSIAEEIVEEVMRGNEADEVENYRDEMMDSAHEYADGHEWVIYTHKAHVLCAYCDTTRGEELLEECGLPSDPTYDSLGTLIAFGELRGRIMEEIEELIEAWEPVEEEEDA